MSDAKEIVVEDDPVSIESPEIYEEDSASPSMSELQKLYEEERQKRETLETRQDPTNALRETLSGFTRSMESIAQRPVVTQQAQPTQEDDLNSELQDFNKNFLDDPGAKILRLQSKALQRPLEGIVKSNFAMAKRIVAGESAEKELFKEYEKEIQAEFDRISIQERLEDPAGAYERAFSIVKGAHFDEIFARKTAQAQSSSPSSSPSSSSSPRHAPAVRPNPLSPPSRPSESGDSRRIVLRPGQSDRIRDMMLRKGIHESEFANYVELLHERGQLGAI